MPDGHFISFEGGEGGGKSTQVRLLAQALVGLGKHVVTTREPGGAPSAEQIRTLLVSGAVDRWQPLTEALLNYAARTEHLAHTIEPALARGDWVITDRFSDSTLAYQGYGHGLDKGKLRQLHELVMAGVKPDVTFVLDLPVDQGLRRAIDRGDGEDRYERMDTAFHDRLRRGFLAIAAKEPGRCIVIDARQSVETIQQSIFNLLGDRFPGLVR